MRKDIVEILKTCKKYGKVQILTNGTIGNAELYREIMEIVDAIQISLDSYEEIHLTSFLSALPVSRYESPTYRSLRSAYTNGAGNSQR